MKIDSYECYVAPEVDVIEIAIESGIAQSRDIDDLPLNNGPKF